ncbi:hypothetical protein KAW08_05325 [bacterium]|nr:hypothetical protein [bacterium]
MENNLPEKIFKVYNEAKNRILLYVEASVPSERFKPLRKLILDELGLSGAERKVRELLKERVGKS